MDIDREFLLGRYHAGRLFDDIFDRFDMSSREEVKLGAAICAELHNTNHIDLFTLVTRQGLSELEPVRFFGGQPFLCELIPLLECPPEQLMQFVEMLVESGGNDGFANQPNAAFADWCSRDIARSQRVVDLACEGNATAIKFLPFALTANKMVEHTLDFLKDFRDERRISAITALGRLEISESGHEVQALEELEKTLIEGSDDFLRANVLLAAIGIVEKSGVMEFSDARRIVEMACVEPGPHIRGCCARILWTHQKVLTADGIDLLLNVLPNLESPGAPISDEVDLALSKLLETEFADRAISCAKNLLLLEHPSFNIDHLDSFAHRLITGDSGRFGSTIVGWLVAGSPSLGVALSRVVTKTGIGERPIVLKIEKGTYTDEQLFFLCRKAIGYFFFHPKFAASIVVSAIRVCGSDLVEILVDLLWENLLINFGVSVSEYLETIEKADPAYEAVRKALVSSEKYVSDLREVGEVKELHPSEGERQIAYSEFADEMRRAHKDAEDLSPFLSMVHRSTLLYGKRSVSWVEDPSGERRPVEMELQTFTSSAEVPRLQIADPVGLDFMLRVFRNERPRQ